MKTRKIELEEAEFEAILLALGYATGAAFEKKEALAETFLWAANALNRGNPNWTIYSLPPDLKPEEAVRQFMASLKPKRRVK
jgi:hypothetical protein